MMTPAPPSTVPGVSCAAAALQDPDRHQLQHKKNTAGTFPAAVSINL